MRRLVIVAALSFLLGAAVAVVFKNHHATSADARLQDFCDRLLNLQQR